MLNRTPHWFSRIPNANRLYVGETANVRKLHFGQDGKVNSIESYKIRRDRDGLYRISEAGKELVTKKALSNSLLDVSEPTLRGEIFRCLLRITELSPV